MAKKILKMQDFLLYAQENNESIPSQDTRIRIFYNPKYNCFVCQEKKIHLNMNLSESNLYPIESKKQLPDLTSLTTEDRHQILLDSLDGLSVNQSYTIGNMMFSLRDTYINLDTIYTNKYFRGAGFAKELIHDLISSLLNEDTSLLKLTIYPLDSLSIENRLTNEIAQFFYSRKEYIPRTRAVNLDSLIEIYEKLLGVKIGKTELFDTLKFPTSKLSTTQPILPKEFTDLKTKNKSTIILTK